MVNKQDYYDVLGVSRNVDEAELKKAYRRHAMKYHPDRNEGDTKAEERFKEIKEAYDVLSDSQKRAAYDQFGHAGVDTSAAGHGGFSGAGFGDIFGDVFGDIFGGGQGGRVHRGVDLRYNLELSLEQAVSGTTVKIRVPKMVACDICNGSGAKKGSTPQSCSTCGGVGQVRMQQGFFSVQQTCPQCRGAGKIITDPCSTCRGQGRVKDTKTISVKVPEGVDNGDIVDQQTFEIENFDDALSIYNKITDLGKEMLEKNLSLLRLGQVIRKKQNEDEFIENWPKRSPSDGEINWKSNAKEIDTLIRATTYPYPGAFTFLKNKKIIVWKSTFDESENFESGKIISVANGMPTIGTTKGTISFEKISVENEINESEKGIFSSSDIGMKIG